MLEYQLICYTWPYDLNIFITEALQCGWQLYGTPFCSIGGSYCQAIVREKPESKYD